MTAAGRSVHHANGLPPEPPKSKWDRWNLKATWWVALPIQWIEFLVLVTPEAFMPTILLDFFNQSYPLSAISTGVADSLGGMLAFLLSPTIGRWSDTYGRKKVILAVSLLNFLPIACLLFYPYLNLWCYLSLRGFLKLSAFGVLLSTISDVEFGPSRAKYYSMTVGIAFTAVIIGPVISLVLDASPTFLVTGGFMFICMVYLFFLMPETLWIGLKRGQEQANQKDQVVVDIAAPEDSLKLNPLGASRLTGTTGNGLKSPLLPNEYMDSATESRLTTSHAVNSVNQTDNATFAHSDSFSVGPQAAIESDAQPTPPSMNPFVAIRLAFKSKFHRNLALIIFFSQMTQNGIIACSQLYLKYELDFTKNDNSKLLIGMGVWAIIIMVFIMPLVLKKKDEKFVLMLALCVDFCNQAMYLLLPSLGKSFFFLISLCQGTGFMSFPAASALISNSVSEAEQGAILAMAGGIRSLTQGIAPVLFSGLFSYFTWDRAFAQFPQAPFIVSGLCTLTAIVLTATQIKSKPRTPAAAAQIEPDETAAASTNPEST